MPPDDLISRLEELGESTVRSKLVAGEFGSKGFERKMVEDWLNQKFLSRAAAAERKKQTMDTIQLITTIIAAVAAMIGAYVSIVIWLIPIWCPTKNSKKDSLSEIMFDFD